MELLTLLLSRTTKCYVSKTKKCWVYVATPDIVDASVEKYNKGLKGKKLAARNVKIGWSSIFEMISSYIIKSVEFIMIHGVIAYQSSVCKLVTYGVGGSNDNVEEVSWHTKTSRFVTRKIMAYDLDKSMEEVFIKQKQDESIALEKLVELKEKATETTDNTLREATAAKKICDDPLLYLDTYDQDNNAITLIYGDIMTKHYKMTENKVSMSLMQVVKIRDMAGLYLSITKANIEQLLSIIGTNTLFNELVSKLAPDMEVKITVKHIAKQMHDVNSKINGIIYSSHDVMIKGNINEDPSKYEVNVLTRTKTFDTVILQTNILTAIRKKDGLWQAILIELDDDKYILSGSLVLATSKEQGDTWLGMISMKITYSKVCVCIVAPLYTLAVKSITLKHE